MNDLTKEELEEINYILHNLDFKKSMIFINQFADKIQFMIDNYCEHELYCTCCNSEQKHIYCANCKKSMKKVIE